MPKKCGERSIVSLMIFEQEFAGQRERAGELIFADAVHLLDIL